MHRCNMWGFFFFYLKLKEKHKQGVEAMLKPDSKHVRTNYNSLYLATITNYEITKCITIRVVNFY